MIGSLPPIVTIVGIWDIWRKSDAMRVTAWQNAERESFLSPSGPNGRCGWSGSHQENKVTARRIPPRPPRGDLSEIQGASTSSETSAVGQDLSEEKSGISQSLALLLKEAGRSAGLLHGVTNSPSGSNLPSPIPLLSSLSRLGGEVRRTAMRAREVKGSGEALWKMDAAGLMERGVISFRAEVLCHTLADAMSRERVGGVSIVDPDNRLIGIVTEFDLINALLAGMDLKKTPAEEVMSESICITEEMAAEEIMTLFQSGHLIRLPVVDAEGRLVGVVRRKNILSNYLKSVSGTIQDAEGGDESCAGQTI